MRIARTVIEAEGFSWILPGLLEQTSFRQFVMHKARRPDEQDFNWYLEFLRALPEYMPAPVPIGATCQMIAGFGMYLKRGPNRVHRIEAFLERLDPSPPRLEPVTPPKLYVV